MMEGKYENDGVRVNPTREIVDVDGVECRRWIGETPGGGSVELFVHRVGASDPTATAWLDARLDDSPTPPPEGLTSWVMLDAASMRDTVLETARTNVRRPNRSALQRQCDALIINAVGEGEVELATALQFLQAIRVMGAMPHATRILFTLTHELAAMRRQKGMVN